jgi:arylsulfatase A-like enzyme
MLMRLLALLCLMCTLIGTASAADRPNVLFIAIDDLNDWIGCMGGHPQTKTPNLDRLAGQAVLFSKAYCAAPACNPSRCALLNGIRPHESGVYLNPQPWRPVLPDSVTLPQHFMANGYDVRGGGKIFHGRYEDRGSWHEWFDSGPTPKLPNREQENPHSRAGGIVWGNLHDTPDSEMLDYRMASWAVDYLKQVQDKPFFLAVGFKRPHMPWQAPGKYYDKFPVSEMVLPEVPGDDLNDIPKAGLAMAKPQGDHAKMLATHNWKYAVQGYLATINFMDGQLGRVLDALESSPHRDNTIICLWSDHGWHLGEKQHWRKFALWERATKAPLMFAVPGLTKAAAVCQTPVDLMDIYPTLADLCGLPIGDHLSGVSLRPLLADVDASWEHPAITTHGRGNHAVRQEHWRYIRYADGSEELYDHRSDPNEWTNIASKPSYLPIKQRLAAHLPALQDEAPDAPRDR